MITSLPRPRRWRWLLAVAAMAMAVHGGVADADEPYPRPLTTRGPAAQPFVLAGPGVRSVIIAEPDPHPYRFPYWGGHAILKRYLEVITGVSVPVVAPAEWPAHPLNQPDTYRIWVGTRTPQVQQAIGADLAKLDDDGFIIRAVDGHDLYISGKSFWGTHFAPYDLLERAAGCRWYLMPPRFWMPKEDGTTGLGDILPPATQVAIPGNTDVVEEPSYKMRYFRIAPEHSFRLWSRDRFHHAIVNILPPDTLGKTNPELFPLIDGQRYVPPPARDYDFQPCISNPQVTERMVQAAREAFDKGERSFSLGMNDSNKYCQCDNCKALAPAHIQEPSARIAYAFMQWYNQIAQQLEPQYGDRRIGILAYAALSAVPPGAIQLHPMIVPYLTRDSAQLFDPREVAEFRETVDRWDALSHRMGIYEYMYGQGFYIPRIYNRYLFANIKNRYGVGCDGFYAEAYPQWALDGPKYWMTAKLLWNHQYDVQSLYADYYRNMFGPAADTMKSYFDFLEETWCTQTLTSPRSNYRWMSDIKQLEIFPPEKCRQGLEMLDQAAARTESVQRRRVEFFRRGFAFTTALSRRYHYGKELEQVLATEPLPRPRVLGLLEQWLSGGSTAELYELRREAQLDQTRPVTLAQFDYEWSGSAPVSRALHLLTLDLGDSAAQRVSEPRSLERFREAVDRVADGWQDKAGAQAPLAMAMVREETKASGVLFVRDGTGGPAPTIDGRIDPGQWGPPVYDGSFHVAYILGQRSTNTTAVYAREGADGKLYLAIDCRQDPKTIGGSVTDIAQDQRYPYKMAQDDAVAICVWQKGVPFSTFRVNALGAWDQPKGSQSQVVVARHEQGWSAEWAIEYAPLTRGHARRGGGPQVAIVRYERSPAPEAKAKTATCTTMHPAGRVGGVVGSGNHDNLMAFTWGARLWFQASAPSKP